METQEVHLPTMITTRTLTATGVGPVATPSMSVAVPWNTSPNSPRSMKLQEKINTHHAYTRD